MRKNAKMTQQELAKELGISQSAVSGYEQDIRFPSASMLLKNAGVFNVSVDNLCGGEQDRRVPDVTDLNSKTRTLNFCTQRLVFLEKSTALMERECDLSDSA